jgi:hypothetical protein
MRRGAKEGGEGEPAGLGIEGQGDRNGHPEGNLFERSLGSIVKSFFILRTLAWGSTIVW